MSAITNAVKLLAQTDDTATVGGWGVIYGGKDLYGETFTKSTDFMLDLVPTKPVLYDHSLGEVKHFLGKAIKVEPRDDGIWVEAELDRNAKYVAHVLELIAKGALGWSSGSVSHLVRMEGTQIKSWPVVEFSLTPTPAEPRTLGVEVIKTLIESDSSFEALMPEAGGNPAAGADGAEIAVDAVEPMEENTMATESQEEVKGAQVDVSALLEGMKTLSDEVKSIKKALEDEPPVNGVKSGAPAYLKTGKGDNETKAWAHWLRTGDDGGIKHLRDVAEAEAVKASNNTDLNILTPADGGYAVPTGHYQGIIAKRDESMLAPVLGVRNIPGKGTTVNVPIDNGTANVFIPTLETSHFDRDAPALGEVPMTLVKYTKYLDLSYELLDDEDSRLMEFLNDYIGRALGLTHNALLVDEALAGGSSVALAAGAAVSTGDVPTMIASLKGEYADGAQFVMKRATHFKFLEKTGDNFQFVTTPNGPNLGLWNYPVRNSESVGAIGTSQKSVIFGNFSYMGFREAPGLTFVRDHLTRSVFGQIRLVYHFRAVYEVLLAEAIKYGQHPTA